MTGTSAEFAVIVVTYRRAEAVERTLAALMAQTVGRTAMEICVVDNGGSGAARARWSPRVDRWVDVGGNLGCAGGRNRGARETSAPILVFIDDDGVPAPDFVARPGEVLRHSPDVVAVRGRAEALAHPLLTTMARYYDRGPRECEDLLTLEGGSAVRRDAYEKVGGYDASRTYHEGIELSGRLLAAHPGTCILYTPRAVLRHDYAQGIAHLREKARMMALAADRMAADPDARAMVARLHALRVPDGRRSWRWVLGMSLQLGFRAAVAYHRFRNPRATPP